MSDCVTDSVPEQVSELFPCRFPLKPHMRSSDARMCTFGNEWPNYISAHEMSDAGFYYLGNSDRVVCFYCGGGLKEWKPSDNAWHEHAKWYPMCEYVLKKQGVEYVKNICLNFPKLHRPQIANPSQSSAAKCIREILKYHGEVKITDPREKERRDEEMEVEMLMFLDPHIAYAKKIGIGEDSIQKALVHQLKTKHCKFSSCEDLLNAILDQTKELTFAEQAKRLAEENKCTKCKKEDRNALCMPCGHLIVCWKCVLSMDCCWQCNKELEEKIRIYKS